MHLRKNILHVHFQYQPQNRDYDMRIILPILLFTLLFPLTSLYDFFGSSWESSTTPPAHHPDLKRTLVAMSERTGLSISQVTDEVLYTGLVEMQELPELVE